MTLTIKDLHTAMSAQGFSVVVWLHTKTENLFHAHERQSLVFIIQLLIGIF